jgi:metal-responsive CopG/Arc/MetJ family transcriptional regulator
MNQKHISVSLGEKLMTAFQEHKILKSMNRSAFVRDAVTDYIERNLKGKIEENETQNEKGEK